MSEAKPYLKRMISQRKQKCICNWREMFFIKKKKRDMNGYGGMRKIEGIKRQSQTKDRGPDNFGTWNPY